MMLRTEFKKKWIYLQSIFIDNEDIRQKLFRFIKERISSLIFPYHMFDKPIKVESQM